MADKNEHSASSEAVLKTVMWLRHQGFKPVPLIPRAKAALNKDYTEERYDPPSNSMWQARELGVGVVVGPGRGGPVDVDLDCDEAVTLARDMLPPTLAVFGRKSKPRSHYLYKCPVGSVPYMKFADPTSGETLVELRGDGGGHQTVMPGSIHEGTGELIEWSEDQPPDIGGVAQCDPEGLISTVTDMATAMLIYRHLWQGGSRNQIVMPLAGMFYYMDYEVERVIDIVSQVMKLDGDDDDTRIKTVRLAFQRGEAGKKVAGAPSLRKLTGEDKVIDRILEWCGSDAINLVNEYNERYATVMLEGRFRIVDCDVRPGDNLTFMGNDDFLRDRAWDRGTGVDGKPYPKARAWLVAPKRRSYRRLDFLPGITQEDCPDDVLNLWTGWRHEPKPGDCSGWRELLRDVICDGDEEMDRWMRIWFANMLREPMRRGLTSPVIIGEQGAGKTMVVSYFGHILGSAYTPVTQEDHVHGKFNRHLATSILMHSDEALFGGDKKHRSVIKSLITDEYRMLEQKGIDAKRIENHLRLILTSNEMHAAPVERGDRRFTVILLGDRRISPKLVKKVVAEMEGDGPSALHHYLINEMDDYDPSVIMTNVKNDALRELKQIGSDPVASWWYHRLCSGKLLDDYLDPFKKPKEEPWTNMVSSPALYIDMAQHFRAHGGRTPPSSTWMALRMNQLTGTQLIRAQRLFANPFTSDDRGTVPQEVLMLSERQSTILNMPTLEECRKAYEKDLGQPVEWPELQEDEGDKETPIRRY